MLICMLEEKNLHNYPCLGCNTTLMEEYDIQLDTVDWQEMKTKIDSATFRMKIWLRLD